MRAEGGEEAHEAEGFEAHGAEVVGAGVAFIEVGEGLDLVADFGVGGEVAGAGAVFEAELAGGLAFGGEVFGFGAVVHQSGCKERDLGAGASIGHVLFWPRISGPGCCGDGAGRCLREQSGKRRRGVKIASSREWV